MIKYSIINILYFKANSADCSNFDPEYVNEEITFTPCNPEMVHMMDENEFEGFSYTSSIFSEITNIPIVNSTQL